MLIKKFKMMKINKNYKYISEFILLTLSLFLVSCEEEINDESFISNDFVSFSFDQDVEVSIVETIAVEVDVYASSAKDSDRTIGLYVDDSSTAASAGFSVPDSVTIPAGATQVSFDVSINGDSFYSTETVVIGMTAEPGLDIPTSVDDDGNVVHKPHTINVTPTCLAPTGLTVSNIADTTADFDWDSHDGNESWEYVVVPAGDPAPTGSGTSVNVNSITITGLNSSTDYDAYVRAICGNDNGNSLWSGPVSFTTLDEVCYTVNLDITFDDYPEETAWQLIEGSSLIAQGGVTSGSITGYPGQSSFSTTLCLVSADYTFVIYDLYSDGICCAWGSGSYSLTLDDGTVLASGGSFGASESTDFTL